MAAIVVENFVAIGSLEPRAELCPHAGRRSPTSTPAMPRAYRSAGAPFPRPDPPPTGEIGAAVGRGSRSAFQGRFPVRDGAG